MEHRLVDFAGLFNFRDMAGLSTSGGRAVRPGLLFRSHGRAPEWACRLSRLRECHGSVQAYLLGAGLAPQAMTALRTRMVEP